MACQIADGGKSSKEENHQRQAISKFTPLNVGQVLRSLGAAFVRAWFKCLRKELAMCTMTHHVSAKEVSRLQPKCCWLPKRMQTPANLATCGNVTLDAVHSCSANNLHEQSNDHAG